MNMQEKFEALFEGKTLQSQHSGALYKLDSNEVFLCKHFQYDWKPSNIGVNGMSTITLEIYEEPSIGWADAMATMTDGGVVTIVSDGPIGRKFMMVGDIISEFLPNNSWCPSRIGINVFCSARYVID